MSNTKTDKSKISNTDITNNSNEINNSNNNNEEYEEQENIEENDNSNNHFDSNNQQSYNENNISSNNNNDIEDNNNYNEENNNSQSINTKSSKENNQNIKESSNDESNFKKNEDEEEDEEYLENKDNNNSNEISDNEIKINDQDILNNNNNYINKELSEEDIEKLFNWLNSISFSKKINRKNIARDFSDGVLYAEILKHYFPKFVDLHNFIPSMNAKQKKINWETINYKILRKISLEFKSSAIDKIINLEKGFIEKHLFNLKDRIHLYLKNRENVNIDEFLCTTKSFIKLNNTNFDDTIVQENMLNNVWSDKEEIYRKEIIDRDNTILKYKMNLELAEDKYRKLLERKYILSKDLQELTGKIRISNK